MDPGLEATVGVFNIVGSLANVAMAVAAGFAIVSWRKQIAGQSSHELAKKLAPLLRQASSHRADVLRSLRWYYSWEPEAKPYILEKYLDPTAPKLHASTMAILDLEDLVHAQWGEEVQELIATIRGGNAQLAASIAFMEREASEEEPSEVEVMRQLLSKPKLAPTYTGPTYVRAMQLLTDLTQEFLAGHLGRAGAKTMSEEDVKKRRQQIDAEIAKLAETENVDNLKALAARPSTPEPPPVPVPEPLPSDPNAET